MTELEKHQLKEYKKYLRLSSERDIYNIAQAAFRLGISRNRLEPDLVETGLIKVLIDKITWPKEKFMIPKSEVEKFLEVKTTYVKNKRVG